MMLALYGHLFSSYTWKALIALYANGTAFEFCPVGPEHQKNGQFVQSAHPAGKFPVLTDGGKTIVEATAIIEYLAVHHSGAAPLIPADPAQAAEMRMIDRVFDNYVMTPTTRIVLAHMAQPQSPDSDEIDASKRDLQQAYHWLERWLVSHEMPPHVSIISCAAAPSLFYADWVERIPRDCPKLSAFRAELLALPEVARCVDDARPFRHFFPPGAPDRD